MIAGVGLCERLFFFSCFSAFDGLVVLAAPSVKEILCPSWFGLACHIPRHLRVTAKAAGS